MPDPLLDRLRHLLADLDRPIHLVGGFVRDYLLGRQSHDIDLIVPHDAIALTFQLADRLGLPAYALDAERDVGRIVVPGSATTLDIARYRGSTLADDLRARDFTINALALPADRPLTPEAVIDHHNGLADLAAGSIRIIHPRSLEDDPLRALRATRFTTQLGFRLTDETADAARAAGPLLAGRVSPERVRDELSRLLLTDAPHSGVALLHKLGLLALVLPEVAALHGLDQSPPHHEAVLPHTLSVLRYIVPVERLVGGASVEEPWGSAAEATLAPFREQLVAHLAEPLVGGFSGRLLLRWSALFHDTGKARTRSVDYTGRIRFLQHDEVGADLTRAKLNRLRFSSEATRRVCDTVAGHMRPLHLANERKTPSRRAIYRYYRALHEAGMDVALLSLADHLATYDGPGDDGSWEQLLAVVQTLLATYYNDRDQTVKPPRLLNGQEIMALLGIGPGRELGRLIAQLEEAQAAGDVAGREQAEAFLKRAHLQPE